MKTRDTGHIGNFLEALPYHLDTNTRLRDAARAHVAAHARDDDDALLLLDALGLQEAARHE